MEALAVAGAASQLALACTFATAGLSKITDRASFRSTLGQMGITPGLTAVVATVAGLVELGAGAGLVLAPSLVAPRVLVATLAVLFAAVGVWALATNQRVRCNCFGATSKGELGWRQIELLPIWLLLSVAAQQDAPDWNAQIGLLFILVLLYVLTAHAIHQERQLWRQVRGDRLAVVLPERPGTAMTPIEVHEA